MKPTIKHRATTRDLLARCAQGGPQRRQPAPHLRCLKSTKRGGVQLKVQFTNDLGLADPLTSHEALVPDADGTVGSVYFDTTPDADPAFINVRAEIPMSAASASGKLFGRLYSTGN